MKKYRGKGIAQKLFELAETQAKNECCRWLWSYPRLSRIGCIHQQAMNLRKLTEANGTIA